MFKWLQKLKECFTKKTNLPVRVIHPDLRLITLINKTNQFKPSWHRIDYKGSIYEIFVGITEIEVYLVGKSQACSVTPVKVLPFVEYVPEGTSVILKDFDLSRIRTLIKTHRSEPIHTDEESKTWHRVDLDGNIYEVLYKKGIFYTAYLVKENSGTPKIEGERVTLSEEDVKAIVNKILACQSTFISKSSTTASIHEVIYNGFVYRVLYRRRNILEAYKVKLAYLTTKSSEPTESAKIRNQIQSNKSNCLSKASCTHKHLLKLENKIVQANYNINNKSISALIPIEYKFSVESVNTTPHFLSRLSSRFSLSCDQDSLDQIASQINETSLINFQPRNRASFKITLREQTFVVVLDLVKKDLITALYLEWA